MLPLQLWLLALLSSAPLASLALYAPLHTHSGSSFFNEWDFYGADDNTTWGNVTYVTRDDATAAKLAYVSDQGRAIIKVDNTTMHTMPPPGQHLFRKSVRITSKASYGIGSLVVADIYHIPYGCSVWPGYWTLGIGKEWPEGGEIDIIEGVNLMNSNQYSLHTNPGCVLAPGWEGRQTGRMGATDCHPARGCVVSETKEGNFGAGFARNGGGVYAMQFDVSGVYLWFFPRGAIPASITAATDTSQLDTKDWGMPSASYPSTTCEIEKFFTPQQIVINISLCGGWADAPGLYAATGCQGRCIDNILGTGENLGQAYWDIGYVRTYNAIPDGGTGSTTPVTAPGSPTQTRTTTQTVVGPSTTGGSSNGAYRSRIQHWTHALLLLLAYWI